MTQNEQLARVAVVDEYGSLAAELAPFKSKLSRLDDLAKTIRSWYADADPELSFQASGERYLATIGQKGSQTVIDLAAAYKALGPKRFRLAATISLKALEEHLEPASIAFVTSKARTGYRSLDVRAVPAPGPVAIGSKKRAA